MNAPLSAVQRLALSRERLRQSMQQPESSGGGSGVLLDLLKGWWERHPLRLALMVAGDAAKAVVQPVVKRHPVALVAVAVAAGALLVWAKPWRGLLKPALLAGLLPQLVSKLVAHMPLDSWLTALASLAEHAGPQTPEQPAPEEPPAHMPAH